MQSGTVWSIALVTLIGLLTADCRPAPDRSRSDLYFGFTRLDPIAESVTMTPSDRHRRADRRSGQ
ncbi:MAG: hypothetical protein R2909_11855 [Gemmatimonadales bacterium]